MTRRKDASQQQTLVVLDNLVKEAERQGIDLITVAALRTALALARTNATR